MNNEKTGQLIYKIRTENNMTQKDIADKLFITSKAVSKWECGLSFPSIDIIEQLADILGISVTEILTGEQIEKENIASQTERISLELLKTNCKKSNTIKQLGLLFGLLITFLCFSIFFLLTYSQEVVYHANLLTVQELDDKTIIEFNESVSSWYMESHHLVEFNEDIYVISAWNNLINFTSSENIIALNDQKKARFRIYYYSEKNNRYHLIYESMAEKL